MNHGVYPCCFFLTCQHRGYYTKGIGVATHSWSRLHLSITKGIGAVNHLSCLKLSLPIYMSQIARSGSALRIITG